MSNAAGPITCQRCWQKSVGNYPSDGARLCPEEDCREYILKVPFLRRVKEWVRKF